MMNTNGSDDADEESQSGSAPFSVTLNEPSDEDTFTSVYPMNDPPGGWMSGCFTTGLGVAVTLGGTGVVGAGVGTAVVSGAAVVGLPITGSTHPPLSTNPPGATNPSIQVLFKFSTRQKSLNRTRVQGTGLHGAGLHGARRQAAQGVQGALRQHPGYRR